MHTCPNAPVLASAKKLAAHFENWGSIVAVPAVKYTRDSLRELGAMLESYPTLKPGQIYLLNTSTACVGVIPPVTPKSVRSIEDSGVEASHVPPSLLTSVQSVSDAALAINGIDTAHKNNVAYIKRCSA